MLLIGHLIHGVNNYYAGCMQFNPKEMINGTEVAKILGVSPRTFFYMAEKNLLPEPVIVAGLPFYKKREITILKRNRDKKKAKP